jgi:hypothetical protein
VFISVNNINRLVFVSQTWCVSMNWIFIGYIIQKKPNLERVNKPFLNYVILLYTWHHSLYQFWILFGINSRLYIEKHDVSWVTYALILQIGCPYTKEFSTFRELPTLPSYRLAVLILQNPQRFVSYLHSHLTDWLSLYYRIFNVSWVTYTPILQIGCPYTTEFSTFRELLTLPIWR